MPRICLLALIGLPAAGKTQLSRWLLKEQANLNSWNLLHVCYDDYLTIEDYKQQRLQILATLRQLIETIKAGNIEQLSLPVQCTAEITHKDNYMIICDDNHYYRSMRYKLHQLCRNTNCLYAQIYICKALDSCLLDNEARGGGDSNTTAIPSSVLKQMHARLEPPAADNAWECHSLTLNHPINYAVIPQFLQSLLACPIAMTSTVQPAKQPQLPSSAHELDLRLRSRIQSHMQNPNQETTTASKASKSRALNEQRKKIMAQFRREFNSSDDIEGAANLPLDYYVNLLNLV